MFFAIELILPFLSIKETLLFELLDDIHDEAFELGVAAYERFIKETDPTKPALGVLRDKIKNQLNSGDIEGAAESRQQILQYK